jgi:hypothetical protein
MYLGIVPSLRQSGCSTPLLRRCCESLIPLLDFAVQTAARDGLHEIVLAMARRGRFNVW